MVLVVRLVFRGRRTGDRELAGHMAVTEMLAASL
jgi:hypothetical protein